MARPVALVLCLLLGLALAWSASRTPRPLPADAPAQAFSAERAMRDVAVIARAPHPTGSPEHARVRDHLLARLQGLGLEMRIGGAQAAEFGLEPKRLNGAGSLENVIGVLPGRDRTGPAVLVMSHYDTTPRSPGAADDSAGVAAALEIARALQAGGQPARDVIFLFTDAEELGLLGARAFFENHTLSNRVGAVLNMEARGGGGRAFMFETGRRNGEMIGLFQRNAVRPSSNSLAVFVYEHMPNGTDFTLPKELGRAGMNFAFIGRPAQYHSPSSTPAALDQGSLQHIGEQVLASARALADAEELPRSAPDAVYSDVLGSFLLAYPAWAGWLVLALAAGLAGFALRRALAGGLTTWRDAAYGAGSALFLLLATAVLLRLARRLAGTGRADYFELLARFGAYETAVALVCLGTAVLVFSAVMRGGAGRLAAGGALAAGLGCSVAGLDLFGLGLGAAAAIVGFASLRRPLAPWGAWAGFLGLGLVLALLLQALAPTTAFIATWPLLIGAAAAAAIVRLRREVPALAVAAGAGALALGQVGAWSHGILLGVGAEMAEPLALFSLLGAVGACSVLLAFGATRASRWTGAALLASGFAVVVFIRLAQAPGLG